ncbi:hypothetical protein SAMN02745866_03749 [Alteromonadaceae bacterium Bs31]|nr:hypothetical protein SAMN02745866_03749 [Alteromonadaceae bacterium Bs31]
MKAILTIGTIVSLVLASTVYGCDEECLKEKAETKNNISFPSYLTWEYCDNTRMDFMTSSIDSLENYKTNHFDTRYKGGMRNIKNYVIQRKEWLQECDQYMQLTNHGRVFDDATKDIFSAMDAVIKELDDLIAGVTYSSETGQDSKAIMAERFDGMFKLVDDHKQLMHYKGRYVTR